MKSTRKAVFIIAALGTSAFIITTVILSQKAGFACGNQAKRIALKIHEANGCVEFWANRYQSAIGSLATLFAAFVAWMAVQKQISSQLAVANATRLETLEAKHISVHARETSLQNFRKNVKFIEEKIEAADERKEPLLNVYYRLREEGLFPIARIPAENNIGVLMINDALDAIERIGSDQLLSESDRANLIEKQMRLIPYNSFFIDDELRGTDHLYDSIRLEMCMIKGIPFSKRAPSYP